MRRFLLTPIEEYFFAEDKSGHPCWIILRFRFRGRFQREPLQQTWREIVQRHPTLHSVVRQQHGRWGWEPMSEPHEPEFHWEEEATNTPVRRWMRLDITRTPAVRLIARQTSDACELSLEGHHMLFDGVSSFGVVHELFLAYARRLGAHVDLPELKPERFTERGRLKLGWWRWLKFVPTQMLGLWFARQLERRTIAPLAPETHGDPSVVPADFPAVLHRCLSQDELAALRRLAQHHAATLNDVLLRDLQAAIGTWRARAGIGTPEDWIVIGIPVSLRRARDRFLPCTNLIGVIALDRRAKSLGNRARLLRRATEDMTLVKRHQLGFTLLMRLRCARLRRNGVARYSAQPGSRATAVLTNLGQPFSRSPLLDDSRRLAVPGAVLEDYVTLAPCRRGTCASIAVALYAGRLQIDLHYDSRALNAAQAEEFFATYFAQLRASVAEAAIT